MNFKINQMKKILYAGFMLTMILTTQHIQSQDLEDILGQIAAGTTNAVYEPEYKFDTYMQMEVSDMDGNNITYNAYLTRNGSNYAVIFTDEGARSVMVFDTKNSTMLVLSESDGEKAGFAMGLDPDAFSDIEANEQEDEIAYEHFRTGKTKTILGYKCDEYLISEDGSEIRVWTSEKLGKEVEKKMFSNQQIFGGAFVQAAGMNGMALEYNFKDGDSGEQSTMKVTRIDLNAHKTISTSDYEIMPMGHF